LDESAHASLAASCEELRARTGNPPLEWQLEMCKSDLKPICWKSIFVGLDQTLITRAAVETKGLRRFHLINTFSILFISIV
jgi:hypothetical protein